MGAYAAGEYRVAQEPRSAPHPLAGHRHRLAARVMAALALRILDFAQPPLADDFGHNTNADLFRGIRTNIQANRRVHTVQVLGRNALGFEALPHLGNFTFATNHTDITRLAIVDLLQDPLIVL